MSRLNDANKYFSSGYSCSGAVLSAYHEVAGLSVAEAQTMARPLAGGAKVKCGAVLGAEAVLRGKYPESLAEKKVREFEEAFTSMNGSLNCRELRGLAGGRRLRSCSGCVSDSAEILEKLL